MATTTKLRNGESDVQNGHFSADCPNTWCNVWYPHVHGARGNTAAHYANVVASLERERCELKDVIADLMTKADIKDTRTARELATRLHRMVGTITDDIHGR